MQSRDKRDSPCLTPSRCGEAVQEDAQGTSTRNESTEPEATSDCAELVISALSEVPERRPELSVLTAALERYLSLSTTSSHFIASE